MKAQEKSKTVSVPGTAAASIPTGVEMRDLVSLSGRDALNLILNSNHPQQVVRSLSRVDVYWLVKKIGEEDALPLLQLASLEQWEHILDMELWERDRLDIHQAALWVERLQSADLPRLVEWLCTEGELFTHYYLWRGIRVQTRTTEEALDPPEGYFTLDNIHYIQILDKEHEETIAALLRRMAARDYDGFQALLQAQAGVLPAELEEELYRLRNWRLAEDGFLPFEEAQSVYAYLRKDALGKASSGTATDASTDLEKETLVPMIPLFHMEGENLLARAAGAIGDPLFMDRLRLEFAGLCNQLLSADQVRVDDLEVLLRTCRKAAGYVNLGLKRLSGPHAPAAGEVLRKNSLLVLFRAGFSLTLELRWEAEGRVGKAWFTRTGLSAGFWGEAWSGMLSGLLRKRPLYYTGAGEEEGYRPFERVAEVEACRSGLKKIFALDALLAALASLTPLEPRLVRDPLVTCQSLLLTYWARARMDLSPPGFGPLTGKELGGLLALLRKGESRSPFSMPGGREAFLRDLMGRGSNLDPETKEVLRETLADLWDEFREEFARVAAEDVDPRFARLILIRQSPGGVPG